MIYTSQTNKKNIVSQKAVIVRVVDILDINNYYLRTNSKTLYGTTDYIYSILNQYNDSLSLRKKSTSIEYLRVKTPTGIKTITYKSTKININSFVKNYTTLLKLRNYTNKKFFTKLAPKNKYFLTKFLQHVSLYKNYKLHKLNKAKYIYIKLRNKYRFKVNKFKRLFVKNPYLYKGKLT